MTGPIENFLLKEYEGLDDQDIADLNLALPACSHTLSVAQAEWPKIAPHVPALLRIAQKIIAKQRTIA